MGSSESYRKLFFFLAVEQVCTPGNFDRNHRVITHILSVFKTSAYSYFFEASHYRYHISNCSLHLPLLSARRVMNLLCYSGAKYSALAAAAFQATQLKRSCLRSLIAVVVDFLCAFEDDDFYKSGW